MAMSTSSGAGGKLPTTLAEINVTPLVDVMLVLLIIFMVTASVETVRVEEELKQIRVERDLVPRKPEPPANVLKDLPIAVPSTRVKQIEESEKKEPKVVLGNDLVFRLDATPAVDCKADFPELGKLPMDASNERANELFEQCAAKAASTFGPNVVFQEKERVNFAADRNVPVGWAAKFMALMSQQHNIKRVNLVLEGPQREDPAP